ncbi:MAG: PEP-CTERM sorting domain-containing protein [Mucilaginibacter sp.]
MLKKLAFLFFVGVLLVWSSVASANTIVISGSDFNNSALVYSHNATYVAGPPAYEALSYASQWDTADVGLHGNLGKLNDPNLSMSFDYSNLNLIGGSSPPYPYGVFRISTNGLWNGTGYEFQIIQQQAQQGGMLNAGKIIGVWDIQTNSEYSPTLWGVTLSSILGIDNTYNGEAFGNMKVFGAQVNIGHWGGAYGGSVDIDSITFTNSSVTPSVPEPTTMLLLGLGLMGVAGIRRKFKQ